MYFILISHLLEKQYVRKILVLLICDEFEVKA